MHAINDTADTERPPPVTTEADRPVSGGRWALAPAEHGATLTLFLSQCEVSVVAYTEGATNVWVHEDPARQLCGTVCEQLLGVHKTLMASAPIGDDRPTSEWAIIDGSVRRIIRYHNDHGDPEEIELWYSEEELRAEMQEMRDVSDDLEYFRNGGQEL